MPKSEDGFLKVPAPGSKREGELNDRVRKSERKKERSFFLCVVVVNGRDQVELCFEGPAPSIRPVLLARLGLSQRCCRHIHQNPANRLPPLYFPRAIRRPPPAPTRPNTVGHVALLCCIGPAGPATASDGCRCGNCRCNFPAQWGDPQPSPPPPPGAPLWICAGAQLGLRCGSALVSRRRGRCCCTDGRCRRTVGKRRGDSVKAQTIHSMLWVVEYSVTDRQTERKSGRKQVEDE